MPNSVPGDQHPNPHAAAWDPNAMLQQPVAAPTANDASQVIDAVQVMMPPEIPPEQQGYNQAVATAAASVEVPELPAFEPTEWDKNLADLKAFKERFGHTNVTTNDNKELAAWVFFQKQQYRNMLNGQATALTPDQANQLLQVSCCALLYSILLDNILPSLTKFAPFYSTRSSAHSTVQNQRRRIKD